MAKGRKTGGRKAGTLNKATADVKALASAHCPRAIVLLAQIMEDTDAPHQARVSAMKELLDRGAGKVAQALTGPEGGPLETRNTTIHEYHFPDGTTVTKSDV